MFEVTTTVKNNNKANRSKWGFRVIFARHFKYNYVYFPYRISSALLPSGLPKTTNDNFTEILFKTARDYPLVLSNATTVYTIIIIPTFPDFHNTLTIRIGLRFIIVSGHKSPAVMRALSLPVNYFFFFFFFIDFFFFFVFWLKIGCRYDL